MSPLSGTFWSYRWNSRERSEPKTGWGETGMRFECQGCKVENWNTQEGKGQKLVQLPRHFIFISLPVLLSKNLMCRSSWAVIVTGSVGWLTTLLIWLFDCKPEKVGNKFHGLHFKMLSTGSFQHYWSTENNISLGNSVLEITTEPLY